MPKKKGGSNIVETNGSAVIVSSDATAIGDNTLTSVKSDVYITEKGHVTKMKGTVVTVAAAESVDNDTPIASTMTDVTFAGVDKAVVKTKHKTIEDDGVIYDVTITKFKAKDSDRKDDDRRVAEFNIPCVPNGKHDGGCGERQPEPQNDSDAPHVTARRRCLAVERGQQRLHNHGKAESHCQRYDAPLERSLSRTRRDKPAKRHGADLASSLPQLSS